MSGQQIAQRNPAQMVVQQIRGDEFKQQIALALPPNVSPDRFQRVTVTALLQTPELARDPESLFLAAIRCAQDGLLPDGREAALVSFGGKAQYLPMIGGYRKIAAEHGWSLTTAVVYANDEFDYEVGMEPRLRHIPVRPGMERGPMIAAYAIARHRDGRREAPVVMDAAAIGQRKAVAKTKDVWNKWPAEQAEKTVGKRAFKKLPLDSADRRVASLLRAEDVDDPIAALYGAREFSPVVPQLPAETDTMPPVSEGEGVAETDPPTAAPIADAGATLVPMLENARGDLIPRAGESLTDIVMESATENGDAATEWLRWALRQPRWRDDPFGDALRLYLGAHRPELLEEAS